MFNIMFAPVRPPYLLRKFYNDFTWNIPGDDRKVYLTFDDGPLPEITEFVLDTLHAYQVKATFFCVGNNVKQHPGIFQRTIAEGHRIGNHTYFHKNGWYTPETEYLQDVADAALLINSNLFRPPYGKIKLKQARAILPHYKIIMWDVISYDWDQSVSPELCLENVTTNTRPGSIVVFHDNLKAIRNVKQVLPKYLEFLKLNQFSFEVIP